MRRPIGRNPSQDNGSGLDQMVGSRGGNGKQSDSGSIWGIEMTGFPKRLNVRHKSGGGVGGKT